MMVGRIFLVFCLFVPAFILNSQEQGGIGSGYENGSTLNVLYRKDRTGKIFVDSRGYGFAFRQGRHVTAKTRSYFELEFQTLKHPKEIKSQGEAEVRRRFVYGKVNTVFMLRGALGLQNTIFAKGDIKAVEVRYSYSLGPTIAFAKPYYLSVYQTGFKEPQSMQFDDENYTRDSKIIGREKFSKGFDEMGFYPAVTGKFNLSFEYAPYTNIIRAIETGIFVDYFPIALPIMARNPAENVIITFHVGFVFGRKWF
jgi:hypothetical protein